MAKPKARSKPEIRKRASATPPTGYKIERGISKPIVTASNQKSRERLTVEKRKVGQSFGVADGKLQKRITDICYRMRKTEGNVFSVRRVENGI